jgi:nucleoside-diphosphate-sugar epimerase
VRELVERGHDVTVFHRGSSEPDLPDEVRHIHGDVARWSEHVGELQRAEPEVVIDMLAFLPEDGRRVIDFKGVARRAVVVSSVDVYLAFGRAWRTEPGPYLPTPMSEDAPLREVVIDPTYDKVGVEREAQSDPDFPVAILRYPAVYGPGDPLNRLSGYIRRMDDARPAIVLDETKIGWRWARGYAEDVGHATALAIESELAPGRIHHVASPVAHTESDWIRLIGDVVGWNGRIVSVPAAELPESLRADVDFGQSYDLDTTRIRAELGYTEVVDERVGLERTISWERAHPPDEPQPDYASEDAVLSAVS